MPPSQETATPTKTPTAATHMRSVRQRAHVVARPRSSNSITRQHLSLLHSMTFFL